MLAIVERLEPRRGGPWSDSQWPDFTESPCVRSGGQAFAQARVTPDDIDVWGIYDSFTYTALATLEGLGVCKKGEAGDFVSDGKLRPGQVDTRTRFLPRSMQGYKARNSML